jgi:hypothetical protein
MERKTCGNLKQLREGERDRGMDREKQSTGRIVKIARASSSTWRCHLLPSYRVHI